MDVRHYCSAEGAAESWWRYEAQRKIVVIVIERRTLVCVDVCAPTHPRYGAFPIVRSDASTWRILPTRFAGRSANGELVCVSRGVHFMIGEDPVNLLHAPYHVSGYLTELSR